MQASRAAKWMPRDFVESTQTGGVFTLFAYCTMLVVFFCEIGSFLSSNYTTTMSLDRKEGARMKINFDVDMYDIECRNLKVAVFAQQSQERATSWAQDFWLRSIDNKGQTFGMAIKPDQNSDEEIEKKDVHKEIMTKLKKELGSAEIDADWSGSHDGFKHKSFDEVLAAHDFTFINFFAGWCSHCKVYAPAWKVTADKIHGNGADVPAMKFKDADGTDRGVRLIKMNCVDFKQLCTEKGIDAYPMLRLYKADGTFSLYEGKRDEAEILKWMEKTIKMKSYGWDKNHEAFERGCNARGSIIVDRIPGHLEMTAGGGDQQLDSSLTNVSHLVKHLSFAEPDETASIGLMGLPGLSGSFFRVPDKYITHKNPLDGQSFVTESFHQTWIHDIKVVSTLIWAYNVEYQFLPQKRLSKVPDGAVPQVQFHYDFEPFSIWIKKDNKKWYEFLTSLLALLGGTFVTMRLASKMSLSVLLSLRHLIPKPGSSRTGGMNIGGVY